MWSAATVLVCALELLGRSLEAFPPIKFVDVAPRGASAHVEGFVVTGDDTIYLLATSPAFRAARAASYRCGEATALKKIASVVVHEEQHVRHGAGEREAYQAQLVALMMMGAGSDTALYGEVSKAMRTVVAAEERNRRAIRTASRPRRWSPPRTPLLASREW
jgi:hypothetical protein